MSAFWEYPNTKLVINSIIWFMNANMKEHVSMIFLK